MTSQGDVKPSVVAEVQTNVGSLRVTPENVVQIRNALLAESQLMADKVQRARAECEVGEPGQDPVSADAAQGFNAKVGVLLDQWDAYVRELQAGAETLRGMAKDYGLTEHEITASFAKYQRDNPPPSDPRPSQVPPSSPSVSPVPGTNRPPR